MRIIKRTSVEKRALLVRLIKARLKNGIEIKGLVGKRLAVFNFNKISDEIRELEEQN